VLKFSGLVLSGLPELFSGLFYVAASRLNSPRFPVVLIRRRKRDCQAVIREGREHLNAESLMVGKGYTPALSRKKVIQVSAVFLIMRLAISIVRFVT